jgi:hypothetical protein
MQATLTGQHACTQLLLLLIWTSRGLHHPYPLPLLQAQTGGPVSYIPANCCCRDFQLRNVASINASGHKFGLVYPGLGWVLWRNSSLLPESLVFHVSNTMCRIAMSARCCCYCCCLCSSGWATLHLPSCPPPPLPPWSVVRGPGDIGLSCWLHQTCAEHTSTSVSLQSRLLPGPPPPGFVAAQMYED